MYFIKEISTPETFAVRQPVLRPGKPIQSCHFEGDNLLTTVHFGIYNDEIITGVISVFKAEHPNFSRTNQYQIRGMAVLTGQQGKGLGEKLVRHAENYVAQNKGTLIWFNAREAAVGFYKKMGYAIAGKAFTIGDIGIHYVMHKNTAAMLGI